MITVRRDGRYSVHLPPFSTVLLELNTECHDLWVSALSILIAPVTEPMMRAPIPDRSKESYGEGDRVRRTGAVWVVSLWKGDVRTVVLAEVDRRYLHYV